MARNPPWTRDELILALDLYVRHGMLGDGHEAVVRLSETLRTLPLHPHRPDADRFRNPNAVALKLANFRALEAPGAGMSRGGKADRDLWGEFRSDQSRLSLLASQIEAAAAALPTLGDGVLEDEDAAEGRLLLRLHRVRERDQRLVEAKKRRVLASVGALVCEVCGFDFAAKYGERGKGFAECHHRRALGEVGETRTSLRDLAIVCANCHRMLHRGTPWPTVESLRTELRGV